MIVFVVLWGCLGWSLAIETKAQAQQPPQADACHADLQAALRRYGNLQLVVVDGLNHQNAIIANLGKEIQPVIAERDALKKELETIKAERDTLRTQLDAKQEPEHAATN